MNARKVAGALLAAILLLATWLRVYQLRDLPAGFYCDEAGLGYNAYALWQTGADEHGVPAPLFVWSFEAAYKNPVYLYAAIAPIALLGLDEASVRLTSAGFGVATVAAVFFLGRAVWSPTVGLLAALVLAVAPWHVHFSRIGFELISFPLLCTIGVTLLVRFTQGQRTLPAALFFLGASLYAYGLARAFVPLFLVGFVLLYGGYVLRRWRQALVASGVLIATLVPLVRFDLDHLDRASRRVRDMVFLEPGMTWPEAAAQFGHNYLAFLSPEFLFRSGDAIVRHAVQGHGQLYPAYLPLLVVGALVAALRRDRASKLPLLWVLAYPVGASLMIEVPSASHGIIGVIGLCLLVARGAGSVLDGITWAVRQRSWARALQAAALLAGAAVLVPQVRNYWDLYASDYRSYAAPSYRGFQYGYREVIDYMEHERPHYPRLMLTADEVNQPYIFALFYRRLDPAAYHASRNVGYDIAAAGEFSRYDLETPVLYALRQRELRYFSDYTVKKEIVAPGGQVEFVIAEVRARNRYLTDWATLGPFANRDNAGLWLDQFGAGVGVDDERGAGADTRDWQTVEPGLAWVDLNGLYQPDPYAPEVEPMCAYTYTTVVSPSATTASLELGGSKIDARVWLNGRLLSQPSLRLTDEVDRLAARLEVGDNALLIKSCIDEGDWRFTARFTDDEGRDIPNLQSRAEIPELAPSGRAAPIDRDVAMGELQIVEGFDAIVRAPAASELFPDDRGKGSRQESRGWKLRFGDEDSALVWHTAVCDQKRLTAVAFTVAMGSSSGTVDLYVNGEYVLAFESDDLQTAQHVRVGAYGFAWVPIAGADEASSGVIALTIPAVAVEPGRPIELRIEYASGDDASWFMLKDRRDTAAAEEALVRGAIFGRDRAGAQQ